MLANQQFAFLVVGGVNVVIGVSAFALLHIWLGSRIGYMGTLVLAYAVAILCAFTLHRKFVFQVRGQVWQDLGRFTLVQMVSFGLNAAVLPFLVEVVGMPVLPAQLVSVAVVAVFSYFGHLLFSFRRSGHSADHVEAGC